VDAREGLSDAVERGLLSVSAWWRSGTSWRGWRYWDTCRRSRRVLLHRSVGVAARAGHRRRSAATGGRARCAGGDDAAVLTYAPLAGARAMALGCPPRGAAHFARARRWPRCCPCSEQAALLQRRVWRTTLPRPRRHHRLPRPAPGAAAAPSETSARWATACDGCLAALVGWPGPGIAAASAGRRADVRSSHPARSSLGRTHTLIELSSTPRCRVSHAIRELGSAVTSS